MMSESHSGGCIHHGSGEIMLFGVRVKVDPMRKSVSMNDLSQYIQPAATRDSSSNNLAVDSGYASADGNPSNGGKERKRGVPWTEDEHKLFLLGLQKVGKGDWRGISRNFVKTRTPTQVASHAQKYFLRRSNLNRRRRRSSLFDITTDSVAANAIPMEEQVNADNNSQYVSGFPIVAVESPPLTVNTQTIEAVAFDTKDQINTPVFPTSDLSITRADYYPNHKRERDSLSLSLSLNLSTFQGFNNGDGIISVV